MNRRLVSLFCILSLIGCLTGTPFQVFGDQQAFATTTTPGRCPGFLSRTSEAMAQYWEEIKTRPRGLRLFFKDGPRDQFSQVEFGGFLTRNSQYVSQGFFRRGFQDVLQFFPRRVIGGIRGENGRLRGSLLGDPNFSFTPFRGLHFTILEVPAALASGFGKGRLVIKRPTILTSFIASLAVIIPLYLYMDTNYIKGLEGVRTQVVQKYETNYEDYVTYDWRFHEIKRMRDDMKIITPREALEKAYNYQFAYNEYYRYRNDRKQSVTVDEAKDMTDHLLFAHLRILFFDGVTDFPGFEVPTATKGPLSDAQVVKVFKHNENLYLKYQVLDELYKANNSKPLQLLLKQSEELTHHYQDIIGDRFYMTVRNLESQGHVNSKTAIGLIQQDFWWQTRFAEWDTIGVKLLRNGTPGQYTRLNDIRSSILLELGLEPETIKAAEPVSDLLR